MHRKATPKDETDVFLTVNKAYKTVNDEHHVVITEYDETTGAGPRYETRSWCVMDLPDTYVGITDGRIVCTGRAVLDEQSDCVNIRGPLAVEPEFRVKSSLSSYVEIGLI